MIAKKQLDSQSTDSDQHGTHHDAECHDPGPALKDGSAGPATKHMAGSHPATSPKKTGGGKPGVIGGDHTAG